MQQLLKLINPNRIFRAKKKNRSDVSRSDHSSFTSSTTTTSEEEETRIVKTPTSVLPQSDPFDLLHAFKLLDKDNDGLIPKSELAAFLTRLGAEPISAEDVASLLVEDGAGVRLETLASQLRSACDSVGDEELKETFEFFDTDRDGRISAEELLRVFREGIRDEGCTLEECKRMIAEVDKSGEGFVCFRDFSRMMMLQR